MKVLQFTRVYLKNSASKTLALFLFFLFFSQTLFAANVLGRPRKMFLVKTEHFDIIYSNESEETALLLVQQADELYAKAAEALSSPHNLRMPVIISPDSDVLSIKYTPYPYNRIIIFDSPADYETAVFDNAVISLFYREIYKALAQSVRSPFNQFIAKWVAGEVYQPAALFNLPYSFIEGITYLADDDFSDLQILSQAKLEGKFPKWSQVTTVRDTYPGEELSRAAGAGFSAFLMNAYGVDKYAKLWEESGKINPLLTYGVFKITYGLTLDELWKQFEESVPLPSELLETENLDSERNYEHLVLTDYGLVWYDRIRHEVDICAEAGQTKNIESLFLADKIERLTLSPDGRYIAVSSTQARTMDNLYKCNARIFDLQERKFLSAKYQLREAVVLRTSEGKLVVAGVNVKTADARLEVYTLPAGDKRGEKPSLIYSKTFEKNKVPFSPVYAGDGYVSYILYDGKECFLCRRSFENTETVEECYSTPLHLQRLTFNPGRGGSAPFYTFECTLAEAEKNGPGSTFTRAGFIYLTGDFHPQQLQLASADVSGGMKFPVVSADGKLLYSAKKFSRNELMAVALTDLPRMDGALGDVSPSQDAAPSEELDASNASLSSYNVRLYNPFKYMADLSFTPFFSLKRLDLNEGNIYWPGLGLSIESETDPCMNTQAVLSFGWSYLPLDFSWANNIPSQYLARIRTESLDIRKDKSAAFYIENSSTPVYIKAGTIFNFNLNGEYSFKVLAGGQFKVPLGIALRKLTFDVQGSYTVSTDYYDQTQTDLRPSLSNWPSFRSAYEMYEVSAKIEYSNIHQYGYSTFEQAGISVGMRAYLMWDMCEVRLLQEAREAQENQDALTNAQKKNLLAQGIADITQFNISFFSTIAIPRLLPFQMKNNWVLSMPGIITAEFVNKVGTAFESSFQVLLIGREIHNSVIPYVLYSRRAGLWFGYDMAFVYDTTEVRLPDIRRDHYLVEVFTDVSYTHAFFAVLNLDLNIMTGRLSTVPINTTLTGTYYPESKGYKITLDVRLHL